MRRAIAVLAAVTFTVVAAAPAVAADDTQVKAATNRVETGAKKIGAGKVGEGVEEAKSVGRNVRDGAVSFGHSVKNFFTRLFN